MLDCVLELNRKIGRAIRQREFSFNADFSTCLMLHVLLSVSKDIISLSPFDNLVIRSEKDEFV